jgi:hypothetical protein
VTTWDCLGLLLTGLMLVIDLHITPVKHGMIQPPANNSSRLWRILLPRWSTFAEDYLICTMAKKRWSQTKGPRAEWSIADTITLLAWLNHSLKHEDVEFETTIVSRLNQAYTLPQINRKLSGLWNKHGPADKPRGPRSLWRDDIFVDGSACLEGVNGLEEDILEKIAESTRILEDEYRLKKAQPAARRLRSTSSLIDFPLLRTTPDTPPKSARTPQKLRHRALSNSLTPSAIKREIEQIQSRDEGHSSVKKKQRRLSGKACILGS